MFIIALPTRIFSISDQDLPFGQVMRHLTIFLAHHRLLDPVLRAAKRNPVLQSALLNAVSAHAPYR